VTVIALLGILIVAAVGFGWLATWIWSKNDALVHWPGTVAAGFVACACVAAAGVGLVGVYRLDAPRRATPPVTHSRSRDELVRGEHLAYLCVRCHSASDSLPLPGGTKNFLASPERTLGDLYAPNLTSGGPIRTWSDGDVVRAIREGVDNAGRPLLGHPARDFHVMSDADVDALVVYLRAQPPVSSETPPKRLGLLGTLLVGAGQYPVDVQPPVVDVLPAPSTGGTPEHGHYLVTISGCADCHGTTLRGGTSGFPPDLIAIAAAWTSDEFVHTLRTGRNPLGGVVGPRMPWQDFARAYSDEELAAIYAYVRSLT
jgi:mono/diheme cytochrome c family protein